MREATGVIELEPATTDVFSSSSETAEDRKVKIAPLTLGLCLGVFLLSVDRTIVAVVSRGPVSLTTPVPDGLKQGAPHISNQFNSFDDIGWYGSAYLINLCCVQPILSKAYTVVNTNWTYVSLFASFEVGSLLIALAPG